MHQRGIFVYTECYQRALVWAMSRWQRSGYYTLAALQRDQLWQLCNAPWCNIQSVINAGCPCRARVDNAPPMRKPRVDRISKKMRSSQGLLPTYIAWKNIKKWTRMSWTTNLAGEAAERTVQSPRTSTRRIRVKKYSRAKLPRVKNIYEVISWFLSI